jgi:hypothetical protein
MEQTAAGKRSINFIGGTMKKLRMKNVPSLSLVEQFQERQQRISLLHLQRFKLFKLFHPNLNCQTVQKSSTQMPPDDEGGMPASAANTPAVAAIRSEEADQMPPLQDDSDSSDDDNGIGDEAGADDFYYWTPERRQSRANQMQGNNLASSTHTTWYTEEKLSGGYVKLTENANPSCSVTVSAGRLNKAKKLLDPAQLACVLSGRYCHVLCTKRCHMNITLSTVKECRLSCFTPAIRDQKGLTAHLATVVRAMNQHAVLQSDGSPTTPVLSYFVGSVKVCLRFFMKVYGTTSGAMAQVRQYVVNGSNTPSSAVSRHSPGHDQAIKLRVCYSFWHHFYDENCQRPNSEVRLFPVNRSLQFIYEHYFLSWFRKQLPLTTTSDDCTVRPPSISTFKRARFHTDFKDVSVRPKHYHCRCYTCATLMARRLKGFLDPQQEAAWKLLFDAHEQEAQGWRRVEESTKARARAEPEELLYLTYDDTSALGLPKFTNRTLKNLGTTRFDVIPFNLTNNSTNENVYVYTVKAGWQKGANRLCSILYLCIRKIKFQGGASSKAHTLVLHADNYCENKNNDLFLFCCELVYRKWFRRIM